MTDATITETLIPGRPGVGVISVRDAATGYRLYVALYGPTFERTRDEALALVTDYAKMHGGINIVETVTEDDE